MLPHPIRQALPLLTRCLVLTILLVSAMLLLPGPSVKGIPTATTRYVDGQNGTDTGDCLIGAPCQTIGYAIDQTDVGDTIRIACRVYAENLDITTSVNLAHDADSACPNAISAATLSPSSGRPLRVADNSTVVVTGLIIQNGDLGNDDNGGGVFISGTSTLTLTDVIVRNNKARHGAGIRSPGTLYLIDSEVYGNEANNNGGGIHTTNGAVVVIGSTIHDNSARNHGGGIFAKDAEVHVLDGSEVSRNQASSTTGDQFNDRGGGIYAENTDLNVADTEISDNRAVWSGGGMYVFNSSNAMLTNVTISGNSAGGSGGGMYNTGDSSNATLTNVTISGNTATYHGGGMINWDYSNATLTNVTISGNTAGIDGGGMHNNGSNPTLANVMFIGNYAGAEGGGMSNISSHPTLTNVTISGNYASAKGGGIRNSACSEGCEYGYQSNPRIQNAIVWGNTVGSSGPNISNNQDSTPTIRFSLVEGGIGAGSIDGGSNLTSDPRFVRAVDCGDDGCGDDPTTSADESANDDYGDLRLQRDSPAIDVGDNNADLDGSGGDATTISDVTMDLAGNPRIAAYKGLAAIVDLGTYERPNATPSFTSSPPTDATEDLLYTYTATTEDDTLGIRPITAQQKPAWLAFTDHGDTTATLSGTPSNADVGDHTVVLRAQDAIGASGYQTFTLTVLNTNDPPSFASNPPTAATVGQTYTYAVISSDPDVGDTRTLTALSKPAWLSLTDNGDGTATLSGTPAAGDEGSVDVVLQVEDAAGLKDEQVFTLTVSAAGSENRTPSFTSQPDTSAAVGQAYSYAVITTDPDAGDTRTLTALSKPAWLTLTDHGDGTATLSGVPAAADVGTHDVVLQVQDAGGLVANQVFAVVVSSEPVTTGGLTGQVTADGTGVPGVTVTVNNDPAVTVAGPAAVIAQDVTDAQGTYSFSGLTPGPVTLTFDPPSGFETPAPVDVTVEAGQTKTVTTVTLDPSPTDTDNRLYLPSLIR